MSKVYVSYNHILSSLGDDSESVISNINKEVSGISYINDINIFTEPFYGSLITQIPTPNSLNTQNYTRLEKMMIASLDKVIKDSKIQLNERVGLIISTTKGNIDALDEKNPFPSERAYLQNWGDN